MLDPSFIPKQIQYDVTLWGPFLWQSHLLSTLIDELYLRAEKVRNIPEHNAERDLAALMHDEWSYTEGDNQWFAQVIKPWIHAYLDTYAKSIGKKGSVELDYNKWNLDNLWVNFQKQYDFNPLHNHSGSLSFVIYLNVPEELNAEASHWKGTGPDPGSIMFQYGEELPLISNKRIFKPKKGDIFIFPSSLHHMVIPFRTPNIERVSVSGNITLE